MAVIVQATVTVPASTWTQPASLDGPSVSGVPAALPAAVRHAVMARIRAVTLSGGSPVRSRSCRVSDPVWSSLRLLAWSVRPSALSAGSGTTGRGRLAAGPAWTEAQ
jgi:hypothetical protein